MPTLCLVKMPGSSEVTSNGCSRPAQGQRPGLQGPFFGSSKVPIARPRRAGAPGTARARAYPPQRHFSLGCAKAVRSHLPGRFLLKGGLCLGWVMFLHPPYRPHGGTCRVPHEVVASWRPRAQQIFPGEALLCLILLPLLFPHLLSGQDWLWFLDNQTAVSAAVRCTSSEQDVFEISHYASIFRSRLNARAWHDWVDTESNISDGLSRLGLACPWSVQQPWHLADVLFSQMGFRDDIRRFFCSWSETVGACGKLWEGAQASDTVVSCAC